jgi:hypothetical protein
MSAQEFNRLSPKSKTSAKSLREQMSHVELKPSNLMHVLAFGLQNIVTPLLDCGREILGSHSHWSER